MRRRQLSRNRCSAAGKTVVHTAQPSRLRCRILIFCRALCIFRSAKSSLIKAVEISPLPLDQMKHFLRVTHDQDDLKIASTTEAATSLIEGMTGRTLITKLIDRVYPRFLTKFEIPGQPVQAVASLKYWDPDGVRQTIAPESYRSFQTDGQMFVIAAVDFTWPSVADRSDAITVSWFAGYGDTSESIPSIAKEFVMMVTRYMYDNSDLTGPQPMWLRAMADAIKTGEVF